MHISVLLKESLKYLNLNDGAIVVDCTLGYGGHSSEILKQIPSGHLFSFDQDEQAIAHSTKRLSEIGNHFTIIRSNFVHLEKELKDHGIGKVDAILFDLGVSSPQLDETERGFSFHKDHRLDMRMDQNNPLSAYEVVNEYPFEKLVRIFHEYGEESYAVTIARQIERARAEKPIETTLELVEIIKRGVPDKYKREKHPARKVFQALRIEVNNELGVFESALYQALDLIKVGGRICVITFHSLEDKICKNIFKSVSELSKELKKLPMIPEFYQPKYEVIKKVYPSKEELVDNPRARSARLRVIEKVRE